MYEVEEFGRIEMEVVIVYALKGDTLNQAMDKFMYINAFSLGY